MTHDPVSAHRSDASSVSPIRSTPTSGAVRVRARYCECDPMGVAHHAAYIPWLEIGRTELLRGAGTSYADLERGGVFLVMTTLACSYRRPVYYDDAVEVRTRVARATRVKIEHEYELVLAEDGGYARGRSPARSIGEVCVTASSTLACVGLDGQVRQLPDWLSG